MQSPFVRASCGCIVIPLHQPGEKVEGTMECILVKACDNSHDDREYSFHFRAIESHKVVEDPNYKRYKENTPRPRPLTDEETKQVVQAIGSLMGMGYNAQEFHYNLNRIGQWSKQIPSVSPPAPPPVPADEERDKRYCAGREAAHNRVKVAGNPYRAGTDAWQDWNDGWQDCTNEHNRTPSEDSSSSEEQV